jgi:hypothetical protein
MTTRFVFATISSLALVFFLALQPVQSPAATVIVIGTPGTDGAPGIDGGPGGDATAITSPGKRHGRSWGKWGGAGGNASAVGTTSTADGTGNG